MKQIILALLYTALIAGSCKKNKDKSPVEQLPPETQTGANTFGCLIDGQVFIPKGDPFGGPIKKAAYQYVNGRNKFLVSGSRSTSNEVSSVGVFGDSVQLEVTTYDLTEKNVPMKFYGQYAYIQSGTLGETYTTNTIQRGQLVIKKFDTINQIVSGTFWFDAKNNSTGKIVQVREGTFDLPYVR
jgi:hypothetical protein